jgi:hypothetical protein
VDATAFVPPAGATAEQQQAADLAFDTLQRFAAGAVGMSADQQVQFAEETGLQAGQAAALQRATTARILGVGAADVTADDIQAMMKHAPVMECHDLLERINSGDDTPMLQDVLLHYCGTQHSGVAPPELRSAHPFVKLHWCETLVRAMGADGLSDRTTVIDEQQCDKSADVFKVLRKMADMNITSACGATNFETAAKMLKNVLGVVVKDGAPIVLLDCVAALRQLRGKQFDLVAWFRSRNDSKVVPVRDQYRPLPCTPLEQLDTIVRLYGGLTDPRYSAVAQHADAMRSAPRRVVRPLYRCTGALTASV